MPPPLALLLCTIFVVLLLRLEHKQAPSVSHSVWIPTIWFLYSSSKPLAIWFGAEGPDMESGSPMDRGFLIVVLCISLLILSKRKINWPNSIRENYCVVILIGYMLVSMLWSDIQFISFKRWSRELVALVMAFMVLSEHNPRLVLQSIIRRSIYILIPFSLLLIKYYPKYGVGFGSWSGTLMWNGVALQKNGLGRVCIVSALFLVWTLIRRIKGRDIPVNKYQTSAEVFLLFLTLYLLMGPPTSLTYSATSTAALTIAFIALTVLFILKKHCIAIRAKTLKIIVILIIAYGTFTPFAGKLRFLDISSVLARDETLTGRSDIWEVLVPLAMKRPVTGYGFGGFWTTAMRSIIASHAHNGYLEVILNLGFIGLVFISIFLLFCCQRAHNAMADDFDWGILFICYLLMAVVHNIGEPSIDTFSNSLTAIILFFSVSSSASYMVLDLPQVTVPPLTR